MTGEVKLVQYEIWYSLDGAAWARCPHTYGAQDLAVWNAQHLEHSYPLVRVQVADTDPPEIVWVSPGLPRESHLEVPPPPPGADLHAKLAECEAARLELRKRLDDAEAKLELRPDRAMLWLRREPEGHFTLLLEAPGFPRRALSITSDAEVESVAMLLECEHRTLATAVLAAWKASKP